MAYGDGSISKKRRSDGRYQGSISLNGKRRYVYAATRAQVRQKLAALRAEGAAPKAPQTVAAWLAEWLQATKPGLKPRAAVRYEQLVRRQIVPTLGAIGLSDLSARDVQRLYATLGETLSPQTVLNVHRCLHAALALAVRWEIVPRNVAALVKPPRVPQHQARVLTTDEATRLLAACAGDRLDALYILALTTGMRAGELCGLRWQDVDWQHGAVSVRVQLVYSERVLTLAETKTRKARVLPLTPIALAALAQRLATYNEERQARDWQEHGVVFCRPDGAYLSPKAFRWGFDRVIRQAGITDVTPHELRHTAATFLLGAGVSLKAVSGLLGHSRVGITADRYAALTPEMLEQTSAAMQRLLGGGE